MERDRGGRRPGGFDAPTASSTRKARSGHGSATGSDADGPMPRSSRGAASGRVQRRTSSLHSDHAQAPRHGSESPALNEVLGIIHQVEDRVDRALAHHDERSCTPSAAGQSRTFLDDPLGPQ